MEQTSQRIAGRGRPALPKELHRRSLTVRLSPALLRRLEAAAAKSGHSLSKEVEERCAAHEALLVTTAGIAEKLFGPNFDFKRLDLDGIAESLRFVIAAGRAGAEQKDADKQGDEL